MRLDNILLRDWRNYSQLTLNFAPGVNLIVGDNAQGKTNLLEAIVYLGSGKAFARKKPGNWCALAKNSAKFPVVFFRKSENNPCGLYCFPAADRDRFTVTG